MSCSNKVKTTIKYIIIFTIILILVYIFRKPLEEMISLLSKGSVSQVTNIIRSWGIWAPLLSIMLMILQSIIAPIPAFLISGANGAIFGIFWGIVVSWIGAMFGATLSFYIARWFGENLIKKLTKKKGLWDKVDQISTKHGFKVVLIGRLLPFISFDFLSYSAGLSKMKIVPFMVSTAIGMIPGTIAYVLLGNQLTKFENYSNVIILVILVLLIIFGIAKYFISKNKQELGEDK